jgi:hypothetical protein
MADMYSDNSTRSAILAAAVAQFSYFQETEPTDMAEDELWYNPDDFVIRRFIEGEWVERGTYIPVNRQRCIVTKRTILGDVTIEGTVYVLRDGNSFVTAPIYDGGFDPTAIQGYIAAQNQYLTHDANGVPTWAEVL